MPTSLRVPGVLVMISAMLALAGLACDEPAQGVPDDRGGAMPRPKATSRPTTGETRTAVFGGGCFWCVEAVFEQLDGVIDAESGYAGGTKETANYEAVCTGATGHAEAVRITYDPSKIDYEKLLEVHFATHDPTTLNRQSHDTGPPYRPTLVARNDDEQRVAESSSKRLDATEGFRSPIVTTLEPLQPAGFYPAAAYHQDYAAWNPTHSYLRSAAAPRLKNVRE